MRPLSIRARALIAALLPVSLVAVVLTGVFLFGRVSDLDASHQQRALAQARQIASAAEFAMFARNREALQVLASNASREPDVRAVRILGPEGEILAGAGNAAFAKLTLPERVDWTHEQALGATRLVVQPIAASELPVDGVAESPAAGLPGRAPLGYVALELSRETVTRRGDALIAAGLAVTFGGLLFGGLLAFRLVYAVTAELSAKKEQAENATLAKSRFLAAASHDLRQPMHALGLFVERLGQLKHDEATRSLVSSVEASVRALQDLLDALLDISRLDAGVVRARPEPVAVEQLWDTLRRQFAAAAAERGVALRLRPSALWVRSDALLLNRILLNLVANAIRYTERGGVLVSCRRRGARVLIEVRDTGVGIPEAMHAEVFKEFVQLGNPERDRSRGLGLGLTIVERTALLLGHALSLRSVPGRGSCFRIEVPVAARATQTAGDEPPALLASLAGIGVLVVDDDALAREAMVKIFESWGCRVSAAASGAEALTRLPEGPAPDAIACDYRLPGGENAIDLIARLRGALGRPVPAFIVSGDTDPSALQAASASGLALLHKPVRAARLRALLQRLLSADRNP
jgi:signal transduction histidine kinase/CheY-like chemotaxis protein